MAESSFAAVAENELDGVYGYLVYLTGDPGVAEDLTAETFEKALRRWKRFDPQRGTARTWLCQLARSTALDHFRAESRRRKREEAYASTDLSLTADDSDSHLGLTPALETALRSLSVSEREVIALRVILELDGAAAARILGISVTACSTRLSRALGKLEEKVRNDVFA